MLTTLFLETLGRLRTLKNVFSLFLLHYRMMSLYLHDQILCLSKTNNHYNQSNS